MLTLVAQKQLKLNAIDVKTAFCTMAKLRGKFFVMSQKKQTQQKFGNSKNLFIAQVMHHINDTIELRYICYPQV